MSVTLDKLPNVTTDVVLAPATGGQWVRTNEWAVYVDDYETGSVEYLGSDAYFPWAARVFAGAQTWRYWTYPTQQEAVRFIVTSGRFLNR